MSIKIVQSKLESYECKNSLEEENALREIAQEIVLSGLSRAGFFIKAVFVGGTALRIIHGLRRFSEDLDFSLKERDMDFSASEYIVKAAEEVKLYGFDFEVSDEKIKKTTVRKEWMKDDSIKKKLILRHIIPGDTRKKIKIKLELDTNPPSDGIFQTENAEYPYMHEISIYNPETLFAGKIHALLCRKYLKGRDWFDFTWYAARGISVNFKYLESALEQNGQWKDKHLKINKKWLKDNLDEIISRINWEKAAGDVKPFLKYPESESLKLWEKDYFLKQTEKLYNYMK